MEWVYTRDLRALERLAARSPVAAAVALKVLVRSGGHPHQRPNAERTDAQRWPVPLGRAPDIARRLGVAPSTVYRALPDIARVAVEDDDGRWSIVRGEELEAVDPLGRPQWLSFPAPLADRLCSLLSLGRAGRAAFAVGLSLAGRLRAAHDAGRAHIIAPVRQLCRVLGLGSAAVVRALATLAGQGLIHRKRSRARAPYVYSAGSAVLAPTVSRRAQPKHGTCATETPLRGTRGNGQGPQRARVADALRAWGGGLLGDLKAKGAELLAGVCPRAEDVAGWLEAEAPALRTASDPVAWLVNAAREGWTRPGKRSHIARRAAEAEAKAAARRARRARAEELEAEAPPAVPLESLRYDAAAVWSRRVAEAAGDARALRELLATPEAVRSCGELLRTELEAAERIEAAERRAAELEAAERRRRSEAARREALERFRLAQDDGQERTLKKFAQNPLTVAVSNA